MPTPTYTATIIDAAITAQIAGKTQQHDIDEQIAGLAAADVDLDAHDADLRSRQAINAARFIPDVGASLGMDRDALRGIVRRIFVGIVGGRNLSPLGRTIAMGHALSALWQLDDECHEIEWTSRAA